MSSGATEAAEGTSAYSAATCDSLTIVSSLASDAISDVDLEDVVAASGADSLDTLTTSTTVDEGLIGAAVLIGVCVEFRLAGWSCCCRDTSGPVELRLAG